MDITSIPTTSVPRAPRRAAWLACACLLAAGCSESHDGERDAEAVEGRDAAQEPEHDADAPEPDAENPERDAQSPEQDAAVDVPDADQDAAASDAEVDAEPADAEPPRACRMAPDIDLLFVIDNSGSMAEEQQKLAQRLPELLGMLATGNRDGKRRAAGEPTDFTPAHSIHVGVVSTDLGMNLAPAIESCGGASYDPLAPDPANPTSAVRIIPPNSVRLDKPFGDNAVLQTSTQVAETGIWTRPYGSTFAEPVSLAVAPDPSCAGARPDKPYLEYGPAAEIEDMQHAFSCIAKLGKNGCGLEQQLEAMLKAVSPATVEFSRGSRGQGSLPGLNEGFLRDGAILTVVIVSDEEDCSIPDQSSDIFNRVSANFTPGDINTRCGKPENQRLLHPVSRYVEGLRALKSEAEQDRIVVAAITGVPLAENAGGVAAHSGAALDALLARPDMQFAVRLSNISTTDEEPVPVCMSPRGDGAAAPGRRFLELARAFGENGVATSICEYDYGALVEVLGARLSSQLNDGCE